jgi:hypothetical protein
MSFKLALQFKNITLQLKLMNHKTILVIRVK